MEVDLQGLLILLQQHLEWYPLMELRDVYKLLYQGAFGSEHLATSSEEFIRHLHQEYARLIPDSSIRLLEPITVEDALFRVNLRAYKSRQQNIRLLLKPLLKTTTAITPDKANLSRTWATFVRLGELGNIHNFILPEVYQFGYWLELADFPVVHHSEVYRREYQPAYRLIAAEFIPELELGEG